MTENSNGVVILITLLNILLYKLQKLQEAKQKTHLPLSVRQICRRFSIGDMKSATNNFKEELVIGKGGFGIVYKGIIDFKDKIVAIKRSKSMSQQGSKEFLTEIEMLSQFQHSHLVSLVGYCDDGEEMILVYDYLPSGSLSDHLYKRVRNGDHSLPSLTWVQRLKICIGAAHGLNYLHTGTSTKTRVIHRDVKTSNILLDENLAAKISDFGLSKTGPANQTCTYVSTRVKGTHGYLDPYYVATRRLTRKSDVYAFGVVLFEVLCGRPAVDASLDEEQISLAGWAQQCFKEGLLDQITDSCIKESISSDSLKAYVDVAIKCLNNQPKLRPTMAEVVVSLESALVLQEKSTHYSLVEIMPDDSTQEDADSSILKLKSTMPNRGHEYTGKRIVNASNSSHHNK
nr:PREDICTED: receptor-like protein kinase ANXUR2 [Daucus carota subsp. sativus]